ncbi:MAG: hypothetical protein R6U32_02470 [Candidatus Woesearchaeota archaeon]
MKKPISATIDEELIRWIDSEVNDRTRYRNKSHLIEVALERMREEERLNNKEDRRENRSRNEKKER